MAAYLSRFGLPAPMGGHKKYSTDANLAGLSHEAEDLESMETAMTIVQPTMGVWPAAAPDKAETVVLGFERGRCVAINGQPVTPLAAMQTAKPGEEIEIVVKRQGKKVAVKVVPIK